MKGSVKRERIALYFTLILIALPALLTLRPVEEIIEGTPAWPEGRLECIISMKTDSSKALLTGYCYQLVKDMADDLGLDCHITSMWDKEEAADSLRSGAADMVVVPANELPLMEGLISSKTVDGTAAWLIKKGHRKELVEVDRWIEKYHASETLQAFRDPYFKVYDPYRSRPRKSLSPYDSIMKACADSIGWDWRMLAAVIYQESKFHIEAESFMGACGLMQMMPATARKFGATDLLDPEQSISAGARLLRSLSNRYAELCPSPEERQKYTLAAYNAGHGRINDCINLGRLRGVNLSTWDSIVGLIPEMRDSSILQVDTVKLGVFQGYETIAYVDSILALYDEFCRIHPR